MKKNPERKVKLKYTSTGDGLIIQGENDEATFLNIAAARIWELCDGRNSVEEIARIIAADFYTDFETVKADVVTFVEKLRSKGFLKE